MRRLKLILPVALALSLVGGAAAWAFGPPVSFFTTGAARGQTIGMSAEGNVMTYRSPNLAASPNYEHFGPWAAVGAAAIEGYVLCWADPATGALKSAYDLGPGFALNFGRPC